MSQDQGARQSAEMGANARQSAEAGANAPGKVLVVDDSSHIRMLLQQRLTMEGYGVEVAEEGGKGYELAHRFHPDVVISDLVMPGVDGRALCKQIRADEQLRGCYIIMLTGRDSQDARVDSLAAGADDFMVKPWDEREFLARIRSGMRIRSLQREIQLKEQRGVLAKLAVTAAHEINNPLTGLIFELQLLQMEERLSPRGSEGLKRVFELAQRIAHIVKRLQDADLKPTKEYGKGIEMYDIDAETSKR